MSTSLPVQTFIDNAESVPIIDVRSPSEFEQGHIPGAHNIPLFDDEERAEVGTLYKQENRDAALKKGLEFVGPKMRRFVERAEKLAPNHAVLLHCWRGGMRSSSFGWLLETAGFDVQRLEDGYQAFRNFVLDQFEQSKPIQILGGYTGSGKTDILHELAELGEQVIDLEGLAHHKGSAFGHLGETDQPTGEQFQNRLGMQWYQLDNNKIVWLEDESRFVGRRLIPKPLFSQMKQAPVVRLEIPNEERVDRLVEEYGSYPPQELKEAVLKIKKRLGGLRTQQAIQAIEDGAFAEVAERVLHYYDNAYEHGMDKRKASTITSLSAERQSPKQIAERLKNLSVSAAT